MRLVDKNNSQLSVRQQCLLLEVNRSGLYYCHQEVIADVWLLNIIREIWLSYPFFGYRKITAFLRNEYQILVNKKRVQNLMQQTGIKAIYPKHNTSKPAVKARIYPYLLIQMIIVKRDQAWMVDITYLKLNNKYVYLIALIDVYSRYIVGWHLSFSLDTESCLSPLYMALKLAKPDVINSDQGSQFTSDAWVSTLIGYGIQISMDGIRRCLDNIYIERFWRTIKYEAIYLNDYTDYNQLYIGIRDYINFYNMKRPHQSLHYKTPGMLYNCCDSELANVTTSIPRRALSSHVA